MNPHIHLSAFNFRKFFEDIVQSECRILYCIGEVKMSSESKQSNLFSSQRTLLNNLYLQDIKVYLGYLLKSGGTYHEKGVDVKMAVEIVKGALKDEYDNCYLVSSDSDLIPAVLEAKSVGKRILYVAFKNQVSTALYRSSKEAIIIDKDKIEAYV
jgi:uncharacterized LabA/DUF88 family protein